LLLLCTIDKFVTTVALKKFIKIIKLDTLWGLFGSSVFSANIMDQNITSELKIL